MVITIVFLYYSPALSSSFLIELLTIVSFIIVRTDNITTAAVQQYPVSNKSISKNNTYRIVIIYLLLVFLISKLNSTKQREKCARKSAN